MAERERSPEPVSLRAIIHNSSVECPFNNDRHERCFPISTLSRIITRDTIYEELPILQDNDDLATFILGKARKVFAIACYCGLSGHDLVIAMDRFKEYHFTDESLPYEMCHWHEKGECSASSCKAFHHDVWKVRDRKMFEHVQWTFSSPEFRNDCFRYDFPAKSILPFDWTKAEVKEGGFSEIYECRIHPEHHDFLFTGSDHVAIKKTTWYLARGGKWEQEAELLEDIRKLDHRNIVECLATFAYRGNMYSMFQWADGGSLGDFWQKNPKPSCDDGIILEILEQFLGLCDALNRIKLLEEEILPHNDVKPENILRFKTSGSLGILKVADLGFAKYHRPESRTNVPETLTPNAFGSARYVAPEVVTRTRGRDETYHVWAFGCVLLEMLIWMIHGYESVARFSQELGESSSARFFDIIPQGHSRKILVHKAATRWMDQIAGNYSKGTAIGDLVRLIRDRLLVIYVDRTHPNDGPMNSRSRAKFIEVKQRLEQLRDNAERQPSYLTRAHTDHIEVAPSRKHEGFQSLYVPAIIRGSNAQSCLSPLVSVQRTFAASYVIDQAHPFLSDTWDLQIDDHFASGILTGSDTADMVFQGIAIVCPECSGLDIRSSNMTISRYTKDIEQCSIFCDCCRLLLRICEREEVIHQRSVDFVRQGATFRLNGRKLPVLTLVAMDPEVGISTAWVRLGLPRLPEAGSMKHLRIIKHWLDDCDANAEHVGCRHKTHSLVPKRVIAIEHSQGMTAIRLRETPPDEQGRFQEGRYIALSHPWGKPPHFCMNLDNIKQYRRSIDISQLPQTFKDAIQINKVLGISYIWIDSLCIIQGAD
ncbi:hypothetical protein BDV96DRAFT_655421 [Lophiotrema nucula]|uniref:Protein kinase domain-containing protein n=1 Tax=Lophiotrema nucula TaxID=690887 RepID=A0A6A5YED5_9PLEO|nr:hypothetical protein BDV96DRAFT_655421 [Lophiotrema nucula]